MRDLEIMPIEFCEVPVRIVSRAIQKPTRKDSIYKVTIVEVLGTRGADHWYANAYPNTHSAAPSLFGHVHALVNGSVGEEILISGRVRKFAKGDSQHVVLDVDIAYPMPTDN
jgi:hypothetical protein